MKIAIEAASRLLPCRALACCLRNDVWLSALPPQRRWSAPRRRPPSGRGVVQLLLYQLIAENAVQLFGRHGLEEAGVQQGSGLVFHIGPHIVPCGGQLRSFQIKAEKAESYDCPKPVREGRTPAAPGGCTPPLPCSRREKRASPPLAAARSSTPPVVEPTECDRPGPLTLHTDPPLCWAILCLSGCGCAIVPGRRVWYTIAIEIFCDTEKLYADHYTAGHCGYHATAGPALSAAFAACGATACWWTAARARRRRPAAPGST